MSNSVRGYLNLSTSFPNTKQSVYMYKVNDVTNWLSQTTDNSKYFVWSPGLWDKESRLYTEFSFQKQIIRNIGSSVSLLCESIIERWKGIVKIFRACKMGVDKIGQIGETGVGRVIHHNHCLKKSTSEKHMSHVMRKRVFGILWPGQLQKLARVLKKGDIASIGIVLSKQRKSKALIRQRRYADWSAPLLFAYGIRHVFSWSGSYKSHFTWSVVQFSKRL